MTRGPIDTAFFLYAVGRDHEYREPCRAIVAQLIENDPTGEVSVEVGEEILHVLGRRGEAEAGRVLVAHVFGRAQVVNPVVSDDVSAAADLIASVAALDSRGAIHLLRPLVEGSR